MLATAVGALPRTDAASYLARNFCSQVLTRQAQELVVNTIASQLSPAGPQPRRPGDRCQSKCKAIRAKHSARSFGKNRRQVRNIAAQSLYVMFEAHFTRLFRPSDRSQANDAVMARSLAGKQGHVIAALRSDRGRQSTRDMLSRKLGCNRASAECNKDAMVTNPWPVHIPTTKASCFQLQRQTRQSHAQA